MGFDAPSPGREDPSGLLAMQMRDGAGKLHAQEPLAENGEDPGVGKAWTGEGGAGHTLRLSKELRNRRVWLNFLRKTKDSFGSWTVEARDSQAS